MLYCLYGLRLHTNESVPGLTPFLDDCPPDVWVWLGAMPRWLDQIAEVSQQVCYVSPTHDQRDQPLLTVRRVPGDYLRLTYADGTGFLVDRAGTRIWGTWP